MQVKKISYDVGNRHGLSGGYLELDPTDSQLRGFLEKVEFKSAEYDEQPDLSFDFKGFVKVQKDKITIVYDVST